MYQTDPGENSKPNTNEPITCIHCKSGNEGKPWITVCFQEDDYTVHACKYLCSKNLQYHIGKGYFKHVVNKEDFQEPRPLLSNKVKGDITANFGIQEIKDEISYEEKRMEMVEDEYEYECGYSSEDSEG